MHTTLRRFKTVLLIFVSLLFASCPVRVALAQSVPMLLQAEAMSTAGSTAPMFKGVDIAAMGGQIIAAPDNATSTTTPVRGASTQINVPGGTYFLWARLQGTSATSDALYVGIDSSFARVFPSAFGPYQWVKVPISDGSTSFGFNLSAGSHAIQVGYGEVGAKLDAVYLTADANDVPTFAPPALRLLIEAEWMSRPAPTPMTLGSDVAALGGQYISPTSGTDSTTPVREANYALNVPAGTYYLWARIAGPTPASDALYAGIGSSFARIFPQTAPSGTYEWVRVPTTNGGSSFGFALTAGVKTIQVGHGEINTRLDALYLTDNANDVPTFAPMRRVIEAESFNLQSVPPTMTVGTDAAANGGQYLTTTNTTSSTTPVREAWTTVTAAVSGTYYLWARIKGPDFNSDAVYVGFDTTFNRVFPQGSGAYEWVRVEAVSGPGFTLSSGPHDIQVGSGEVGARLDAVYVTDNANDSPPGSASGSGGFPAACALPSGGYEGYGRNTLKDPLPPRQVYAVTRLDDNLTAPPQGSLRDALGQPNRCIIFSLPQGTTGEINLVDEVHVPSNVMIDGFTAPAPGISLRNTRADGPDENADPPVLWLEGVNNVVIRGIRIRRSPGDGIRVMNSENVVIDRVSVNARPPTRHDLDGIRDGTIDVVSGSRNVTVQWSLLNGADLTMLLGSGASRVSVHHNLFADNKDRQPKCAGPATVEPVCDTRNNLIWAYRQAGTAVRDHGTGNVINNYYHAGDGALQGQTIWVQDSDNTGGLAFTNGNLSQEPNYTVATGNHSQFFIDPADIPARITDARTAALEVKAGAGARGPNFVLDSTDQTIVNGISIP